MRCHPATQDGLLEVPSGYELTPVPDEYDYVPAPTITGVGAATTPDGDANADPGSYGAPSVLDISGTGLNYQTMNWLSFGDPTTAADQDISYPAYADGTNVAINAPADPNGTPSSGSDPDFAGVTADTLGGQSSYDTSCSDSSADCVTYAGLPGISSVATPVPTDSGVPFALAPDTGGTAVTIQGAGLSDVVGPLEFADPLHARTSVSADAVHVQRCLRQRDRHKDGLAEPGDRRYLRLQRLWLLGSEREWRARCCTRPEIR